MSTLSSPPAGPSSPTAGHSRAPGAGGRPAPRLHRSGNVDVVTWRLAVANLVAQIGIIVTGGLVRLTGSGLGCSTWPMCEPGQFTPVFHEEMGIHPVIEFGNRTLTGVLGVIALALLVALYRREPTASRGAGIKGYAWVVLAGIAVQAVVGGFSVLGDLHPLLVGFHMMLSLLLVAVSAVLLVRLAGTDGVRTPVLDGLLRALPAAVVVLTTALTYLGTLVTGTGPHSGDASEILRLGFEHETITRAHALSVWLFVAVTVVALVLVARDPRSARSGSWHPLRSALALQVLLCLVVGGIGYIQYATGLPVLMISLHMLGSALVVAAAAVTWAACYARVPVGVRERLAR